MNINDELKERTMRRIYAVYGSSSGVLFGITDKKAVELIIQFTIRQVLDWKTESEEVQLEYKNPLTKPYMESKEDK